MKAKLIGYIKEKNSGASYPVRYDAAFEWVTINGEYVCEANSEEEAIVLVNNMKWIFSIANEEEQA